MPVLPRNRRKIFEEVSKLLNVLNLGPQNSMFSTFCMTNRRMCTKNHESVPQYWSCLKEKQVSDALQAKRAALFMEYSFHLREQMTGKLYIFRPGYVWQTFVH